MIPTLVIKSNLMNYNNQATLIAQMDKAQIKSGLRQSFGEVVYAIHSMSQETYSKPRAEGKWSPKEVLGHLWLSTTPVVKSLSIPKEKLMAKFGTLERAEYAYDDLKSKYIKALTTGIKAPPPFVFSEEDSLKKEELLSKFNQSLEDVLTMMENWNEKELSMIVIPHPAIGKVSMREILYFTEFHTIHHLAQLN